MPDRVPGDAIGAVFILVLHRFKSAVLVAEAQVNPCERVRGDIAPFGEILQFLDQLFGVPSAASHRVCRPQGTEKRRRTLISSGRSFENLDVRGGVLEAASEGTILADHFSPTFRPAFP